MFADIQAAPCFRRTTTLAEKHFCFSQLADDLLGGDAFSRQIDLPPFSNPSSTVGSVFGEPVRVTFVSCSDTLISLR
jgi:hypothetical protein